MAATAPGAGPTTPAAPATRPYLVREGTRSVIAGLPSLDYGGLNINTSHFSASVALAYLGRPQSYEWLMGASGGAFRYQLHEDGFCGSSPHTNCGYSLAQNLARAGGLRSMTLSCPAENTQEVARIRAQIAEAIDSGKALVVAASEEETIVAGHEDNGTKLLVQRRETDGTWRYAPLNRWPWGFTVYSLQPDEPQRKHLVMRALKRAVALAEMRYCEGYHAGLAALEQTARELENDTWYEKATPQDLKARMQGNAWIFQNLVGARRSASVFLSEAASCVSDAAAKRVRNAAAFYDQEWSRVLTDESSCCFTIAPYPHMLKAGESWTVAQRREQARRLRAAIELERKAIAEIQAALDAGL